MADERYKEGFKEYLRPFGFDPDAFDTWRLKRIRQEDKRLNMLSLLPLIVGLALAVLRFMINDVRFSNESWTLSMAFFSVFLVTSLFYILSARFQFKGVKRLRNSFTKAWKQYLTRRIKYYPVLIAGIWPASFALINLTYDTDSGWVVKVIVSLLVALAAGYLLQSYLLHDYRYYYKEVLEKE